MILSPPCPQRAFPLYPGQEEIRSPHCLGKRKVVDRSRESRRDSWQQCCVPEPQLGSPRGQSNDGNPGERGASFLGGHSGPEGTSGPLLLQWGTPTGEERTAPRACMEPTTLTFLGCPVAGPWSGCCGGGHCPPGGRGWGFGRWEGVALEACSGKRD